MLGSEVGLEGLIFINPLFGGSSLNFKD